MAVNCSPPEAERGGEGLTRDHDAISGLWFSCLGLLVAAAFTPSNHRHRGR